MQIQLSDLAKSVARLSEIYTRQRQDLSASLLRDPLLRQAYLLYFFPANIAKLKSIIREIRTHPAAQEFMTPNPRILDLGCGPGTHLIGFLDYWLNDLSVWESLDAVGVDSVNANLRECQTLFFRQAALIKEVKPGAKSHLQTVVADLTRLHALQLEGEFDFIVFGDVLNELYCGDEWLKNRYKLVSTVVTRWLARRGFLILLEPALRETSRQLLKLRDRLLTSTDLKVYAPCVHNGPCPAVSRNNLKDWCHEERTWSPPELIVKVNRLLGSHKNSLKFSYVILSRLGVSVKDASASEVPEESSDAVTSSSQATVGELQAASLQTGRRGRTWTQGESTDAEVWRVVSELMEEKGKTSVYLCGERERCRVTRLDKHRSPVNQDFLRLDRGCVVRTESLRIRGDQEARVESGSRISVEFCQNEDRQ